VKVDERGGNARIADEFLGTRIVCPHRPGCRPPKLYSRKRGLAGGVGSSG
jgi:hypothetical protein